MLTSEDFVNSFLNRDSFIILNENMVKALGGNGTTAIILSKLINLHKYYKDNSMLEEGWFYLTVQDIIDSLGISYSKQNKALKHLEELEIVKSKLKGVPARRYFKLDFERIADLLEVRKPEKDNSDKTDFYTELNSASNAFEFGQALGNIPKPIGELLYGWSHLFRLNSKEKWNWTSKSYGQIKNFWKANYKDRKDFDYMQMVDYYKSKRTLYGDIVDFMEYVKVNHVATAPKSLRESIKYYESLL